MDTGKRTGATDADRKVRNRREEAGGDAVDRRRTDGGKTEADV